MKHHSIFASSLVLFTFAFSGVLSTWTLPAGASTPSTGSLSGANLNDCFDAALKRSEDIASQQELIYQAEEKLSQAKGSLLPTLSGSATYFTQEQPNVGTATSISPANQRTVKITAAQPLFRGFREFAAIRQQNSAVQASTQAKAAAVQLLFQDVVQTYYQVLAAEKDLKNLKTEIAYNEKRLKELEYFKKLGRSRESEVLLLQSNIAQLESQVESLQGQLDVNRSALAFLTGFEAQHPLYDSETIPSRNENLDRFISKIDSRPDIASLKQNMESAEEGIKIAKGAHLPTLDLLGNYYLQRPGLLSNVSWDFQLALNLPIFQGGVISSQIRQASSIQKQNELALEKARRKARQEIETLFSRYEADYAQHDKQEKAVRLSEKTYQAVLRDYRLGLITNLEVLQAITAFQSNQRVLDQTQFQLKSDFIRLEAAATLKPDHNEGR